MLCALICIHERCDLQLKVDSERQIFLRNFSWQFLFTLRVFARNLLRGNRRRNIFFSYFVLMSDLGVLNPRLSSNKPVHNLLVLLQQEISFSAINISMILSEVIITCDRYKRIHMKVYQIYTYIHNWALQPFS